MRRGKFLIVWCVVAASGCAGGNPMYPSAPSVLLAPTPAPAFKFNEPFTELALDQTVQRHVAANGPDCVDLHGWNCHFFRITPASDGVLDVYLAWTLETQPVQALDLSLGEANGWQHWADYGPGPQGHLHLHVSAGQTYQITVWYMFIGVDYEIGSSFDPD